MSFSPRRQFILTNHLRVRHVHCLGDSIVYGGGIAFNETQSAQLETALHQDFPADLFVCTNFGHEGWDLWNSSLHYAALPPEVRGCCDLVILTLSNNDAELLSMFGIDYSEYLYKKDIWSDPLLVRMVKDGLGKLKQLVNENGAPLLVCFFQYNNTVDGPVCDLLQETCDALGLPFLDLMRETHRQHPLSHAEQIVSAADYHPSAAYTGLSTRLMSREIKRLGLLREEGDISSIIGSIQGALQDILANCSDRQSAYLWAYNVAQAKQAAIPRKIDDREARKAFKNDIAALIEEIERGWSGWQLCVETYNLVPHFYRSVLTHWYVFANVKSIALRVQESLMAIIWAQENDCFEELEKRARPIMGKRKETNLALTLPNLEKARNDLAQFKERFRSVLKNEGSFGSSESIDLFVQSFHYVEATIDIGLQITNDLLTHIPTLLDTENALPELFRNNLSEISYDFYVALKYLNEFLAQTKLEVKPHPPTAYIDAYVTIKTDEPSAEIHYQYSLTCVMRPEAPALVFTYYFSQALVCTEGVHRYHLRFPYFAASDIRLRFRHNFGKDRMDLNKFYIAEVEFRPVICRNDAPSVKPLVFNYEYDRLQSVDIESVSFSY